MIEAVAFQARRVRDLKEIARQVLTDLKQVVGRASVVSHQEKPSNYSGSYRASHFLFVTIPRGSAASLG